jgi:hypothetical protein
LTLPGLPRDPQKSADFWILAGDGIGLKKNPDRNPDRIFGEEGLHTKPYPPFAESCRRGLRGNRIGEIQTLKCISEIAIYRTIALKITNVSDLSGVPMPARCKLLLNNDKLRRIMLTIHVGTISVQKMAPEPLNKLREFVRRLVVDEALDRPLDKELLRLPEPLKTPRLLNV